MYGLPLLLLSCTLFDSGLLCELDKQHVRKSRFLFFQVCIYIYYFFSTHAMHNTFCVWNLVHQ